MAKATGLRTPQTQHTTQECATAQAHKLKPFAHAHPPQKDQTIVAKHNFSLYKTIGQKNPTGLLNEVKTS